MAALADFWCGSLASTSSCLDDFAMAPLKDAERRDFLEICDDRYQRRSMILTSQMPSARLRLRMWMIFRHDYKGQRRELRRLIQSSEYSIHIAGIRILRASMP
jgi:DNA replication protein DnaC